MSLCVHVYSYASRVEARRLPDCPGAGGIGGCEWPHVGLDSDHSNS